MFKWRLPYSREKEIQNLIKSTPIILRQKRQRMKKKERKSEGLTGSIYLAICDMSTAILLAQGHFFMAPGANSENFTLVNELRDNPSLIRVCTNYFYDSLVRMVHLCWISRSVSGHMALGKLLWAWFLLFKMEITKSSSFRHTMLWRIKAILLVKRLAQCLLIQKGLNNHWQL